MARILFAFVLLAGLTLSACTPQTAETPAEDAAEYEMTDESLIMDEEYTELEEGDMTVTQEDLERLNAEEMPEDEL